MLETSLGCISSQCLTSYLVHSQHFVKHSHTQRKQGIDVKSASRPQKDTLVFQEVIKGVFSVSKLAPECLGSFYCQCIGVWAAVEYKMARGIICRVAFRGISISKCSLQIAKQYRQNTPRVEKSNRLSVLCVPVQFLFQKLQDLTQLSVKWFWSVVIGLKCCSLTMQVSMLSFMDCAVVPQSINRRIAFNSGSCWVLECDKPTLDGYVCL